MQLPKMSCSFASKAYELPPDGPPAVIVKRSNLGEVIHQSHCAQNSTMPFTSPEVLTSSSAKAADSCVGLDRYYSVHDQKRAEAWTPSEDLRSWTAQLAKGSFWQQLVATVGIDHTSHHQACHLTVVKAHVHLSWFAVPERAVASLSYYASHTVHPVLKAASMCLPSFGGRGALTLPWSQLPLTGPLKQASLACSTCLPQYGSDVTPGVLLVCLRLHTHHTTPADAWLSSEQQQSLCSNPYPDAFESIRVS